MACKHFALVADDMVEDSFSEFRQMCICVSTRKAVIHHVSRQAERCLINAKPLLPIRPLKPRWVLKDKSKNRDKDEPDAVATGMSRITVSKAIADAARATV